MDQPWPYLIGALATAIPATWAVVVAHRTNRDQGEIKRQETAVEGFAELVEALETRLLRTTEELDRAEAALKACREGMDKMHIDIETIRRGSGS
jgi:septal ring factor EnvC (AmiA/AmiB activator)